MHWRKSKSPNAQHISSADILISLCGLSLIPLGLFASSVTDSPLRVRVSGDKIKRKILTFQTKKEKRQPNFTNFYFTNNHLFPWRQNMKELLSSRLEFS